MVEATGGRILYNC